MRAASWLVVILSLGSANAYADDDRDAQRQREELAGLDARLQVVAADPGRETAPTRSPPWCSAIKDTGSWSASSIGRTIDAAKQNGWTEYFRAAPGICRFAKEPAAQKAAAIVEQTWINITGLSDADAVESITARLDAADFAAAKLKLCGELEVSDEVEGEELSFMKARRALFGCVKKGWADQEAIWAERGLHVPDDLVNYMDANSTGVDEVVRLALINDHIKWSFGDHEGNYHGDLSYVLDQYDFRALDPARAMKMLETAPYKGNLYARIVLMESIGIAKRGLSLIDEEVKKRSKDADWKDLLVTAPAQGIADYEKAATKWKGELDQSNELEHKFWGPSKRAMKGCLPGLRKDFATVARTLKHANLIEFKESLSDPIASLLFTRLAACGSIDGNPSWADKILALSRDLRASRGPRLAAYWAAVDTLSKILADRSKFPVSAKDFWFFKDGALHSRTLTLVNQGHTNQFIGFSGKGVIKTAKKTSKGTELSFQTEKHQEMGRSCKETGRILTFRADGSPLYYQSCHDTGLITVNDTADPVTIPAEWSDGLVPGAAIEFDAAVGPPPARLGMPKAVYADKSKKKLVGFFGIGL